MGQVMNVKFSTFSLSTRIKHIIGDGNCFFWVLSFSITGEEDQHTTVREYICDFIALQGKEIGGINPKDYLKTSK